MKFATLLTVVLEELPFKKFIFFNLMLPWQPNKIITGHKTHKLGRQSSNDHNCQIWFISHHWLPWQPNQEADCRLLAIFNCLYPFNICIKLQSYCLSGFGAVVIKKIFFFLNLMLPWKPNKMATGHEMHKRGR